MGFTDIERVDELGRVAIPKEYRNYIGLQPGDAVEICAREDLIIIRKIKFEQVCVFCNRPGKLMEFRGKPVCRDCAAKAAALA